MGHNGDWAHISFSPQPSSFVPCHMILSLSPALPVSKQLLSPFPRCLSPSVRCISCSIGADCPSTTHTMSEFSLPRVFAALLSLINVIVTHFVAALRFVDFVVCKAATLPEVICDAAIVFASSPSAGMRSSAVSVKIDNRMSSTAAKNGNKRPSASVVNKFMVTGVRCRDISVTPPTVFIKHSTSWKELRGCRVSIGAVPSHVIGAPPVALEKPSVTHAADEGEERTVDNAASTWSADHHLRSSVTRRSVFRRLFAVSPLSSRRLRRPVRATIVSATWVPATMRAMGQAVRACGFSDLLKTARHRGRVWRAEATKSGGNGRLVKLEMVFRPKRSSGCVVEMRASVKRVAPEEGQLEAKMWLAHMEKLFCDAQVDLMCFEEEKSMYM